MWCMLCTFLFMKYALHLFTKKISRCCFYCSYCLIYTTPCQTCRKENSSCSSRPHFSSIFLQTATEKYLKHSLNIYFHSQRHVSYKSVLFLCILLLFVVFHPLPIPSLTPQPHSTLSQYSSLEVIQTCTAKCLSNILSHLLLLSVAPVSTWQNFTVVLFCHFQNICGDCWSTHGWLSLHCSQPYCQGTSSLSWRCGLIKNELSVT